MRDVFAAYDGWIARRWPRTAPCSTGPIPTTWPPSAGTTSSTRRRWPTSLAANAERLAATVEAVPDDGWDRVGIRRGEERSVLFTARRAVHEGNHHLLDIGRGMRAVREARRAG